MRASCGCMQAGKWDGMSEDSLGVIGCELGGMVFDILDLTSSAGSSSRRFTPAVIVNDDLRWRVLADDVVVVSG